MLLVLLVVLGGLLAQPAVAAPLLTATELMTRIDAAQKDLHSLRADFVQHSRVKLFRQQISSTGRFLYAKGTPARLRWEYLAPDPSTMLLVGDQARLTPVLLTAFAFTGLLFIATCANLALLLPKAQSPLSRVFSRIELHVDGKSMLLRRLLMVEQSGDEKEVVFGKIERNIELNPAQFQ